ncbi:hypothetical protein GLOIN_2v1485492 [Rhizophagus clarus]|uniref:Uncharacterized protein n=1 Tax=Rhizophagus clarus TaxID=94130 RepID=A0A8H3R0B8_9GLOM|nr:hypothetical protein GLOIN_2v1485492 [Rhizophagus clarus]
MYKPGTTNLESESEQELNQRGTRVHDGSDSDSDSGSNSRPEDNSEEQRPNPSKKYLHMSELRKDMRDALRRDLFWNLARLPQEFQLDIEKTFESQKDLVVKTIVPNLMKTLDLYTYPIAECVVYEMIHQRHRYQRDILRNKEKPQDERKRVARQKHSNSRRLEKKRRRSKTIAKLKNLKDPLIEQFKDEELLPIVRDNGYHSPEFSSEDEVDEKNKIVVHKNTKSGIKKRERVYRPSEYVEEAAPSDAPDILLRELDF